jgi:hypothetical protein
MKLKNRQMQIPNGYRFLQSQTGWKSTPYASFESIVNSLINHRKGRPDLVSKHGWALDHDTVANEVERFNVDLCLRHGWTDYLDAATEGFVAPPKPRAPSQEEVAQLSAAAGRAKKIWAGVRTITDWMDAGADPVEQKLAESRAAICAKCPKNGQGDFTTWFTSPAAGAIKRQVEKLADRKLTTSSSEKLNICEVCLCPLKLKVHTPVSFIKAHMSEAVLSDLKKVEGCWIPAEVA